MKLQSWIVIFSIIVIPIVIVMSLYMQVQINYINLQGQYDTILNNATYDAIKAFQINELNSTTQNIAQEKIRDVEASVNTFYNSLATNFGQGGYSEEELQEFVPALVYTLYDGYYIYTKYNNVAVGETTTPEGETKPDINLSSTDSTKGLKPYVYYSARYKSGSKDIIINYTLDNYITVFYKNGSGSNYETYSGYIIDTSKTNSSGTSYKDANGNNINIGTEALSEVNRTTFEESGSTAKLNYKYITNDAGRREKAYWEDSTNSWYKYNVDGTKNYVDKNMLSQLGNTYSQDNSAQKYLQDAYAFTNKIKPILSGITWNDIVDVNKEDLGITANVANTPLIDFSATDGTMLDGFNAHKQQVIKNSITTNLEATIAKFNENSTHSVKMPTLTENEWNLLLSNTCLISFMQGQNLGNGTYMGYSIVTNNKNREFIDPKLIYILDQDNNIYHDVRHLDTNIYSHNLMGYRNTDFEAQSFVANDGTTKNYFPHGNATADYECIVTSASIITSNGTSEKENAGGNATTNLEDIIANTNSEVKQAYYTALFRERCNSYKSLSLGN